MNTPSFATAALMAALAISSCSMAGGASGDEASMLPDARFVEYSRTLVIKNSPAFVVKAATAEIYSPKKKTDLRGLSFTESDPDSGALLSQGKADAVVFYNDTQSAEFAGSVRLESKKQDIVLEGEELAWDGPSKKLSSRQERSVTISRSDGSRIRGAGFAADARRRSFSFSDGVEGLVMDTKSPSAEPQTTAAE